MSLVLRSRKWFRAHVVLLISCAGVVCLAIAGQQHYPPDWMILTGWGAIAVAICVRVIRMDENGPARMALTIAAMCFLGAASASPIVGRHLKDLFLRPSIDGIGTLISDRPLLVSAILFLLIFHAIRFSQSEDQARGDRARISELQNRIQNLQEELQDRPVSPSRISEFQASQLELINAIDGSIHDIAMTWISSAKDGARGALELMDSRSNSTDDIVSIVTRSWLVHGLDHSKIKTEERYSYMADALWRAREATMYSLCRSLGVTTRKPNLTLPENMPRTVLIKPEAQ